MPAVPTPTPPLSALPAAPVRPEILAPAGDWECARAAVENGADAIYFGLERFNARMRARNFTLADLPQLMEFLHRRGVRGYVTFNTLVFADEIAAAGDYLRGIIAAGADAVIVQDVGVCRLIRRLSPDFPIHISTQMTVTSAAGVDFARDLGAQLVVLARENSLRDIAAIRATLAAAGQPLPLEVFVHGALCVAYSGQCLTSESLGGRSANRGECAQACRLPYELVADGRTVELGDRRYLLSPQDLAGLDLLPELVQAGVASLKIEGRLKSPEYVANVTRVYRQALDAVMAKLSPDESRQPPDGRPDRAPGQTISRPPAGFAPPTARYDLEMAFSRGLYPGWFRGINNQELAHARYGTKRGVFLGQVTHVGSDHVTLRPVGPLKPGDGLVFDAGRPQDKEQGGRVYQVQVRPGDTVLRFGHGDLDFSRIHPGDRVWKTNDPELDRRLRQTFAGGQIRFRRPISLEIHGHAGAPLTVIARDATGHNVREESSQPLAPADNQPLTTGRLRDQLGRLGGTPYALGALANHLEGGVILPVRELNELRRRVVAGLDARRTAPLRWQLQEGQAAESGVRSAPSQPAAGPEIIVVVRSLAQLEAGLGCEGVGTFYCEFENPKHYRDAVTRFRQWQSAGPAPQSSGIWVAPPRIFKPGEDGIIAQVLSCGADGYLVRNHDHLQCFAGRRRRGDFSLNVANPLTAEYYLEHHGLERVTASYDLNVAQLESLLRGAPPAWFDITLHQHMPMFHMEHCVYCAFLSTGTDYRNCGRPCDRHDVRLRDRIGAEHPLQADAGCRNTVYNARAQTGAEFAGRLLELGARSFRLEFLRESGEELQRTVGRYRQLLRGEISGSELWREFKLINQLGVTRGQLEAAPRTLPRKGA